MKNPYSYFLPTPSRVTHKLVAGLLVVLAILGGPAAAVAQCTTCAIFITSSNANDNRILVGGETVTIGAGVSYTGKLTVRGSNVTIINKGNIAGNGGINVNSGVAGTVIHNLGTVPSQNIVLSSPTTINNGSSDGGLTVVAGASWTGYVGENFKAATTISNYAAWDAQINSLPGGTIANKAGATWTRDLTNAGALTVLNGGTWSGHLQTSGSAATFTVTNARTGVWTEEPTFISAAPITINNEGQWSAQINYQGPLTVNHTYGTWGAIIAGTGSLVVNNRAAWTKGIIFPNPGPNAFNNFAGATATLDSYLRVDSPINITNSGTMTMTQGMSELSAASVLTNSRGAIFQVTGQLINSGRIDNSGTLAVSDNFTNNATGVISGPTAPLRGSVTAGNYTRNYGTFGVSGRLDFCDTNSRPASGFDVSSGTVGPNTTFCTAMPLPVELTSFTAEVAKGKVLLHWATASERNSAKFVVERSARGEVFEAVQEVAGMGTSVQATVYAATDARPLPGKSYYRLRQVDKDGTEAFSPVVSLRVEASQQAVSYYPNPATDRLTLDLSAASAEPCEVRLIGLTGQLWLVKTLVGSAQPELSLAGVPAGLYLLQVRTSTGITVQRIQKQ